MLDVRSDIEHARGHIRGSLNIPLAQLLDRIDEVPTDRTVVVVCQHGNRSSVATDQLARHGRAARLLDGGLRAWRDSGRPVVRG